MQEIEVSSRLYLENEPAFMTATLPARTDSDDLLMGPVTFVLAGTSSSPFATTSRARSRRFRSARRR